MIEKVEYCPNCGSDKEWLYDAQKCTACAPSDLFRVLGLMRDPSDDRSLFLMLARSPTDAEFRLIHDHLRELKLVSKQPRH